MRRQVLATTVENAATPSTIGRSFTRVSSRLHGYWPALGAFLAAILLHAVLLRLFGAAALGPIPFFLYLLTFLAGGWCGYGPGLVVTILITCGMPYLFKPGFSVRTVDQGGVAIFLLLSLIVSGTSSSRRQAEALLRKMNDELDARVQEQTKVLRTQLAELEALYAQLSVGLCFLDGELRLVRANDKFAAMHGISGAFQPGSELRDFISEELAAVVEPMYRGVLASQEAILEREIPVPGTSSVDCRFWAVSCSPVKTSGRLLGVQILVQDISERTKAVEALNDSNAKLRRANEDLEQFAFSASHDLQEPLRNVAIYTQLLEKRFGGLLGCEGKMYVGYAVQGALRMEQLVRDLLVYAQKPHAVKVAERGDSREALEEALSNLDAVIREAGATVTASNLPVVAVKRVHLVQVFQNLIGNSVKYRDEEPPRIHIDAVQCDGDLCWRFCVRDNGIGIDPQYHGQIFGVFKRLHRHEQYPGTGIGLAICKKIVEAYGGRIWVESGSGKGTSFQFTVPAAQERAIATA